MFTFITVYKFEFRIYLHNIIENVVKFTYSLLFIFTIGVIDEL